MTTIRPDSDQMWRAMTITMLETIYCQTVDRKAQREIHGELERRDEEAQS